jgi:heptaprenylglyceryl phosphate synthase
MAAAKTTKSVPSSKTLAAEAVAKTIPSTDTEEAQATADATAMAGVMRRYHEAVEGLGQFFELPSWKRSLIAIATYVAGCVGIAYLTTSLVEFVLIGAVALSAPLFLGIIIAVIAAVMLVYYGHSAVARVTGAILTKEADERALAAYDATKAMLRRFNPFAGKAEPAAAA